MFNNYYWIFLIHECLKYYGIFKIRLLITVSYGNKPHNVM